MSTIAVTGTASGMGLAIRKRLEADGHRVVGVDVRDADIVADLSTVEGRQVAIGAIEQAAGDGLDGLVACAGLGPHVSPTDSITRVNYFGAVELIDGLLPALAKGETPAVVAISSNSAIFPPDEPLFEACLAGDEAAAVAAVKSGELDGAKVYATSKRALARAVRQRVSTFAEAGVRLNAICPGPVQTPMLAAILEDETWGPPTRDFPVPLGRRGEPEDIAEAVQFLLGPQSTFIHGAVIFVDGGGDALFRPETF